MTGRPWHLPWRGADVPHAVLDVNRGCNLRCRGCINTHTTSVRSVDDVARDLDGLLERRHLASVTILGGETRLHPDIAEIVRRVKARGLDVELLTNGLVLDDPWLEGLAAAGLDILYLHLDGGQTRPEFPPQPTAEDLRGAWTRAAGRVADHGLDVGLSVTLYPDRLEDAVTAVDFVLGSPVVHYVLVTLYRDSSPLIRVVGDLETGLSVAEASGPPVPPAVTNHELRPLLQERLGIRPFGTVGSAHDPEDLRWMSYLVATAGGPGPVLRHAVRPSLFERAYLALHRLVRGRYPMYQRQDGRALATQLVLNGFTGGDLAGNLRFLARSRGRPRLAKRLLFQCPAEATPDGTVLTCVPCPDACLKQDRLVPICIADRVDNGPLPPQSAPAQEAALWK